MRTSDQWTKLTDLAKSYQNLRFSQQGPEQALELRRQILDEVVELGLSADEFDSGAATIARLGAHFWASAKTEGPNESIDYSLRAPSNNINFCYSSKDVTSEATGRSHQLKTLENIDLALQLGFIKHTAQGMPYAVSDPVYIPNESGGTLFLTELNPLHPEVMSFGSGLLGQASFHANPFCHRINAEEPMRDIQEILDAGEENRLDRLEELAEPKIRDKRSDRNETWFKIFSRDFAATFGLDPLSPQQTERLKEFYMNVKEGTPLPEIRSQISNLAQNLMDEVKQSSTVKANGNKPTISLQITERNDDIYVCIAGQTELWGCGATTAEAMGDFVKTHRQHLGIYIVGEDHPPKGAFLVALTKRGHDWQAHPRAS